MMKQQTLTGFERCAKTTRRAQFLADMHVIVPWAELTAVVEPFYPKISEAGGRPPLPLERMLRVYFLQLWFNLSDPAVEEALYESTSMRNFAGIDLGVEAAPDESRRTRDCEAQSEDVSAETCRCIDRERNPIAISVFSISFSDVP
jgi:IS5 family transposase